MSYTLWQGRCMRIQELIDWYVKERQSTTFYQKVFIDNWKVFEKFHNKEQLNTMACNAVEEHLRLPGLTKDECQAKRINPWGMFKKTRKPKLQKGPRGGQYYISPNGRKVYKTKK